MLVVDDILGFIERKVQQKEYAAPYTRIVKWNGRVLFWMDLKSVNFDWIYSWLQNKFVVYIRKNLGLTDCGIERVWMCECVLIGEVTTKHEYIRPLRKNWWNHAQDGAVAGEQWFHLYKIKVNSINLLCIWIFFYSIEIELKVI